MTSLAWIDRGAVEARVNRRWIVQTRSLCAVGILAAAVATPGFSQAASSASASRPPIAPAALQTSLVETQWNLMELNGGAVDVPASGGQVYIYLQEDGSKLSGSDGCNRLFGSYDLSGSSLQFHSVAQTMMACRGAFAEREAEFLEMLKLVASYQISDSFLQLRVDDRVLARFRARKK